MKTASATLITYAIRTLRGEWRKYLLPFISLTLTAMVISVILFLTASASAYLFERNRDLVGGDVALRANFAIDEALLATAPFAVGDVTRELSFSGTLRGPSEDAIPVSFRVVDNAFPLVGDMLIRDGSYAPPTQDQVYVEANVAERLGIGERDAVYLGEVPYTVAGIIEREPDALIAGFRFFPRVIIGTEGFARSGLDPDLLRADHRLAFTFESRVERADIDDFVSGALELGYRVDVAGSTEGGLLTGLAVVERFLIIAVLVTIVLASVNVYVSMLYLLKRLRRTFAVLRALGATRAFLLGILGVAVLGMVFLAGVVGVLSGIELTALLRSGIAERFGLELPAIVQMTQIGLVFLLIASASVAACVPAWLRVMGHTPRALLAGGHEEAGTANRVLQVGATLLAGVPLLLLAIYLLESVWKGVIALAAVALAYAVIAFTYRGLLVIIYRLRHHTPFTIRSITAQKYDDGLFGTVSFTSLYLALTALAVLSLTYASLTSFLAADLARTLPPIYVLDVQRSQVPVLTEAYPELILFPNVGARILEIDDVRIQEALAAGEAGVDRELGREFNITYRTYLLESERIREGTWTPESAGTFSVEADFARRAGIVLGSWLVLSVQGIPVEGMVTSIREADTRSGLPFFFIIGSPEDFEPFPTSFFGYAYYEPEEQRALTSFISANMPNVSVLDTREVGAIAEQVIQTLIVITFAIVVPPLVLASLLVVALVLLSYSGRRRDSARLLAIGARRRYIERLYLLETVATTLLASVAGYLTAVGATMYLTVHTLSLDTYVLIAPELAYVYGGLLAGVALVGILIWKQDKTPLQRTLAYEENY